MRSLLVLSFALLLPRPTAAQADSSVAGLKVRDSTVVLADGRTFVPGLRQLRAHGVLDGKGAYVVLSGFGCEDCDAVRSVYVMRFGQYLNWSKRPWPPVFAYPGTIRDTENLVVARSRLFFGACGDESTAMVIQFASTRRSGQGWTDSIHVAALKADTLVTKSSAHSAARLTRALQRVSEGVCVELAPNHRQVESE